MRVGYHSGTFEHKADTLPCSLGRSTGYFGTGYYFCTKPERCRGKNKDDPFYKMYFKDDLKWFRGTESSHDTLKQLTSVVLNWDVVKPSVDTFRLKMAVDDIYDFTFGKEDSFIKSWFANADYEMQNDGISYEDFCRDNRHLISRLADCGPIYLELLIALKAGDREKAQEVWEGLYDCAKYLNSADNVRGLQRRLDMFAIDMGTTKEKLCRILDVVYHSLDEYRDEGGNLYLRNIPSGEEVDSISTRILKHFGYDGVWPTEECNNTTYGGVVYDKENFTMKATEGIQVSRHNNAIAVVECDGCGESFETPYSDLKAKLNEYGYTVHSDAYGSISKVLCPKCQAKFEQDLYDEIEGTEAREALRSQEREVFRDYKNDEDEDYISSWKY